MHSFDTFTQSQETVPVLCCDGSGTPSAGKSLATHGSTWSSKTNANKCNLHQTLSGQTMMGTATHWTWKNAKSRLDFFDKILDVKSFKNAFFSLWEGRGAFADGS